MVFHMPRYSYLGLPMNIFDKYTIVRESGSSYKAFCPECGRKALYITPNNGLAYCFVCGFTEKFGEQKFLLYVEDINVEKITEVYQMFYQLCEPLPFEAVDYLTRRGFSLETIQRFGLVYCPNQMPVNDDFRKYRLTNASGVPYLKDRIIIPYFYGDKVINLRGRDFKGHEPKYKSAITPAKKFFFYPFNWTEATQRADREGYIILTEGELKAVAAHEAGYPVCAVSGIRNIPPGLSFKRDWRIILAFDNEFGNHVAQAVKDIARWYRNIYVAILPRLGKLKMDIDDLIREGRKDLFDLAIREAIPVQNYLRLVGV